MKLKYYLIPSITILAFIAVLAFQSVPKQPASNTANMVTVSGKVFPTLSGLEPMSLSFRNHGGSDSKTWNVTVTKGSYSIQLGNHDFYDISAKYSPVVVNNTTVIPPSSNCATLPLISNSLTFHYDVSC